MQAIILAAGMGRRLKELTNDKTKCMIKVGEVTLIERMLRQLDKLHLAKVVIVVGFKAENLVDFINSIPVETPIEFIKNPIYDKTNNIYSLGLAKRALLEDNTLLFESDIIFEGSVLDALVNDPRETLTLVDRYESWMDGTCVRINDKDEIIDFIPTKKFDFNNCRENYKTVNIYKFSKSFSEKYYVPFLEAYLSAVGDNEYYEQVLQGITMLDNPKIGVKRLNGEKWYEIDDVADLDIATSLFADEDSHVNLLANRYGGYWRYPKLTDFCYLVNPYFPPKRMVEEIKANFDVLLRQYPSGMKVNALIAAKNFNVKEDQIIVGNGAAELIKALMSIVDGKVGFIRPTFEEYPNRYNRDNSIVYYPDNENFAYDENNLIAFFSDKDISTLVLINPDNPTGNYIKKEGLLKLIAWALEKGIKLVVDESFVDFADEANPTLVDTELLAANKHLYVMKSISKSCGVPGLRLGVLASGDVDAIKRLKRDVSIWNINSFGEFYLQIEEKYKKDYALALDEFRAERRRYAGELKKIKELRILPSEANYIMVEVLTGMSARCLTKTLLAKHEIFIKDLSSKILGKEFLRLAVRNTNDNDKLIAALSLELTSA